MLLNSAFTDHYSTLSNTHHTPRRPSHKPQYKYCTALRPNRQTTTNAKLRTKENRDNKNMGQLRAAGLPISTS